MGSGAARDLEESKELPELNPELGKKLTAAMTRLDALDVEFKEGRANERLIQLVKIWGAVCKEIDRHFLTLSNVLNDSHQLNLEPGSDGGGRNIIPWMEEAGGRFERLQIQLQGEDVICTAGEVLVSKSGLKDISYAWCERLLVKWLVMGVKAKL